MIYAPWTYGIDTGDNRELHIFKILSSDLRAHYFDLNLHAFCVDLYNYRKPKDCECRIFKEQWGYQYFVTEWSYKAICTMCNEAISVFKEYMKKIIMKLNILRITPDFQEA